MLIFQPLAIIGGKGICFQRQTQVLLSFWPDFGVETNSGSARVRVLTFRFRPGSGLQKSARLQLCLAVGEKLELFLPETRALKSHMYYKRSAIICKVMPCGKTTANQQI